MLGYFVLGTLAAFGLLSLAWVLFGWLLPSGSGCAAVCYDIPDEEILWRFRWLKSLGFLNVPLLIVAEDPEFTDPGTEICSREDLLSRLEWERDRFDGTGNGNYTGRDQCRGISEL